MTKRQSLTNPVPHRHSGMRMRTALIPMVMVMMLASSHIHFCRHAVSRSAQMFRQYFSALGEESLNPVERVVFSLVLANAKAQPENPKPARHGA